MNTTNAKNDAKEEKEKTVNETKKAKNLRKLTEEEKKDLCFAIVNCDDEKAKILINLMTDVDENICEGTNALNYACNYGRLDLVKYLLDLGAANKTDEAEYSPLMNAVMSESVELVKLFISSGADINYITSSRYSALSLAAEAKNNSVEIFEFLISSGIDINKCGGDALTGAAFGENIVIVERLIELGADINYVDYLGMTPLHFACQQSSLEIVQLLMEYGADENIKDNHGQSPIEFTESEEVKEFISNYNSTKFVLK